jgi:hypothetical protein
MIYLCPQRGCSGVHNLSQDDVGRTFACNKCGSMLRFDGDSLRLLSPPASPVGQPARTAPAGRPANPPDEDVPVLPTAEEAPAPAARPAAPHPRHRSPAPMSPQTNAPGPRVLDVLFTGLYAVGASFVILFLFLPLIDRTDEQRIRAAISEGELRQRRLDRQSEEGRKDGVVEKVREGDKDDADRRKKWEQEKQSLEDKVEQARITATRSFYYYTWGMLIGFLILAFASAGYVAAGSTPVRRVLGAVTLIVQVLLIFLIYFFAGYAGLTMRVVSP